MPEFASCYFCGTALDAQIEPYPVVPEEAATDDRPTVDLCPVCRRKLSKVLDVALSAAEGAEVTATPLAAGPDPSPLSADHEDPTADLGSEDDGSDDEERDAAYAVEPSGEATAVEGKEGKRSEPSEESSGEHESERNESPDGRAPESRDEHGGSANDASGAGGPASSADDGEGDAETANPATAEAHGSDEQAVEADDAVANGEAPGTVGGDAESEAADGSETDDSESSEDETGVAAETDAETGTGVEQAADESDGSDRPSILSTPAAQKVIKLLQNREFPVEREEIEVVASNAYEIPHRDCADVIDALVDEDYVDERKGKLRRPEE